jgi:hypothetical protein
LNDHFVTCDGDPERQRRGPKLPNVAMPATTTSRQGSLACQARPKRKTGRILKEETRRDLLAFLDEPDDSRRGLEIGYVMGKQRAVFSQREFKTGQFVIKYAGELVTGKTGALLEKQYEKDPKKGSYMYFFHSR